MKKSDFTLESQQHAIKWLKVTLFATIGLLVFSWVIIGSLAVQLSVSRPIKNCDTLWSQGVDALLSTYPGSDRDGDGKPCENKQYE